MAGGAASLYPYMNSRNKPVADVWDPATMAVFAYTGSITFRWGEAVSGTPNNHILTAKGQWGGVTADHHPILWVVASLPGSPTAYATKALMEAAKGSHTSGNKRTSDDVYGTDGDYALVGGTDYYYLHAGVWCPVRTRTSAGTATINGVSCNIKTCTVPVADIPPFYVNTVAESMDADEIFDLCWAINGRHASSSWDAAFKLSPEGYQLQDANDDRRELNARVAGQKSIKQDEMITRSQIQPGDNVQFEYLDDAGQGALGYTGTTAEGFDILIHSRGTFGDNIVSGINLGTGAAISWSGATTNTNVKAVYFSDEPDWTLDVALARLSGAQPTSWAANSIPVHVEVVESPTGTLNYSFRTAHTGLYASHDNLSIVTQAAGGVNDTIGHIQFKDTATVTFTITDGNINGTKGYRPGITVEANAAGSLPDQPSLITRWWWTPQYGIRFDGDWALGSQYLGVSNWFDCHSEMSFSPWGPMDDSLNIAGDAAPLLNLIIEHEEKWTGPSGAFTKVTGRQTRASVLAGHTSNYYPYTEGALQVNQNGYYHLDWKAILALQRVMNIDQNTAWNFDYYSIWNLRLAVFRTATGEWHWHSTTADSKWVHHQRETNLLPYQNNFAKSFASMRTDLQGSCDIWLNNGDKIQFYLDSKGKNGNNQALQIPGGYQNDYSYLLDTHAWQGNLTGWEFNMHWLHDDTAFSKNDSDHPNAANAPNMVFDLIDPTWTMPYVTFPTYSEFK